MKCEFCDAPYNGYDDYCEECGMRLTPYNKKKKTEVSQSNRNIESGKCPSCTSVNIGKTGGGFFSKSKNHCNNCGFEW